MDTNLYTRLGRGSALGIGHWQASKLAKKRTKGSRKKRASKLVERNGGAEVRKLLLPFLIWPSPPYPPPAIPIFLLHQSASSSLSSLSLPLQSSSLDFPQTIKTSQPTLFPAFVVLFLLAYIIMLHRCGS